MNPNNKVSVIIPAYNAEDFIRPALNSTLEQTLQPFEIIVVDDGSTDSTAKIVSSFPDPVKLIQQSNGGVSSARNTGIKNAQGDVIAFLDADDLWAEEKLEKQIAFLNSHPEVGTIITDELYFIDDHKVVIDSFLSTRLFAKELPDSPSTIKTPLSWLFSQSFIATSSVICRQELIDHVGFFDESLSICEDRDMWIRLGITAPIALIPEVLVHKRQEHGSNLSAIDTGKWFTGLESVISRHESKARPLLISEGSDPNKIFAYNYKMFADYYWHNNDMQSAKKYYLDALKRGSFSSAAKFLSASLGQNFTSFIRNLKRLFKSHG